LRQVTALLFPWIFAGAASQPSGAIAASILNAADKDSAFSHSWVLEDWKESGMPEELSAKAKAALLKLNEHAASDQPLMVEWDIQTELEKRELVSAAPHGGCLITKKGRAYVQEMNG